MFDFALIFDGQHYYYDKHERNDSVSCIYDKFDLSQNTISTLLIFSARSTSRASDRNDLLLNKYLLLLTVFRYIELVFHYF